MVTWPCGGSLGAKGLSTSWGMGGPERGGTEARLCGTWLPRELYVWGGFHHSVHLSILGDSPDSSCSRATSGWSAEGHKVFTLLAGGARAVTHTPRSVLGTEKQPAGCTRDEQDFQREGETMHQGSRTAVWETIIEVGNWNRWSKSRKMGSEWRQVSWLFRTTGEHERNLRNSGVWVKSVLTWQTCRVYADSKCLISFVD